MKKVITSLLIVIIAIVSILTFVACGSSVVPFAYTTYKLEGDQVAYYSSVMYGTEHIYVFEDATKKPNPEDEIYKDNSARYLRDCYSNSCLIVHFKRILGAEEVDGVKADLVDIEKWYYIEVIVFKNTSIYSPEKAVYLNGEKLTIKSENDSEYDGDSIFIFHYDTCGLKRSNPNGRINNVVNYIEYK